MIKICSREYAVIETELRPKFYNSIIICSEKTLMPNHGGYHRKMVKLIGKQSKTCVYLRFDDVNKITPNYKAPSVKDIKKALNFAEGKDNLLVACAAGISRSSATAYVIARSRFDYETAISILEDKLHWPNDRIITIGESLLKKPLVTEIEDWKQKNTIKRVDY